MSNAKTDRWLIVLLILALAWGAWSNYANIRLRREHSKMQDDLGYKTALAVQESSNFLILVQPDIDMTDEELLLFERHVDMMARQARSWGLDGFKYYYDSMLYALEEYSFSQEKDKALLMERLQAVYEEIEGLLDLVLGPRNSNGGREISIDSELWFLRFRGRDSEFNRLVSDYIESERGVWGSVWPRR